MTIYMGSTYQMCTDSADFSHIIINRFMFSISLTLDGPVCVRRIAVTHMPRTSMVSCSQPDFDEDMMYWWALTRAKRALQAFFFAWIYWENQPRERELFEWDMRWWCHRQLICIIAENSWTHPDESNLVITTASCNRWEMSWNDASVRKRFSFARLYGMLGYFEVITDAMFCRSIISDRSL